MRGEILFPKPRSRQTTNQHNSLIVISNWRYFGNKGQQQKAQIGGGGDYPIQADFGGNTNAATTAQVTGREEAAIGQHRQGKTSTDEDTQYDPGGTGADPFISAKWPCCILFLFCLPYNFPCYHTKY